MARPIGQLHKKTMKTFYLPACALLLLGCNEPGKQDSNSTTPTEDPSPAAEEQDPNTISFTKVKRAPGDVRHQTERLTMNMTFSVRENEEGSPQKLEQSIAGNEIIELTILEATPGSTSRVQLKVIEKESAQKAELVQALGILTRKTPVQDKKETSPLTGKTLLLSRQGEEIIVTDEAGNPVDEVTRKAALEEADNIFDESGLKWTKFLPGRPVKLGETFNLEGQEALEIWGKNDGTIKEASVSFTLKERVLVEGRECARFDATLLITGVQAIKDGPIQNFTMKGSLILDTATSRPTQLKLNGTVTWPEQKGPQGIIVSEGTGTMTMEMEATYSKK